MIRRGVGVKRARQLSLPRTSGWGGRRAGAGRKRRPGSGVSHRRRAHFTRLPVHVTLRVLPRVWNLRSQRGLRALADSLHAARDLFGMRLCDWSIQGNHLHLLVEAESQAALCRAMQGLNIRIARALNRLMGTHGKVFADRYHARALRSLREVRNVLNYVLHNHAIHAARAGRRAPLIDAFTSRGYTTLRLDLPPLTAPPSLWLLKRATAPPG